MEEPIAGFTDLERAVIEKITAKPVAGMDIVKRQFAAASVVKRDYTGMGFYATISVPRSWPPIPDDEDLRHELVAAAFVKSDPEELILFDLWTDAGYLACLEGTTTKRCSWPDERAMEVVPTSIRNVSRRDEGRETK